MVKFLAVFLFVASTAQSQVNLTVSPNSTLSDLNAASVGMVLNQMNDGTLSQSSLIQAVKLTGSKRLRFPEGESADNYYFTDPSTLSAPRPSTHRVANTAWWPAGTSIAGSNGTYAKGLNFDQFMTVAKSVGAVPNIVLCYPCTDKVKALEMAKAWVKYSKAKGYNINQWEIGNETYLYNPDYTDLYQMTVNEYAKDIIEWSIALKAIDPNIKIGANGNSSAWFYTLLTFKHPSLNVYGAQAIDFLAVHSYHQHGSNFANYQANQNPWGVLDFAGDIKKAESAINQASAVVKTSHIRLAMTETSSMNFSSNDPNNLGSALMTVEMLLEALKRPKLDYAEIWASRWTKNFTSATPLASDTFSATNKLNASGLGLSVVSKFIGNRSVFTSGSTATLRVFGNLVTSSNTVNTIIVNRASSAQTVTLNIQGKAGAFSGTLYRLTGKSPTDTAPVLSAGSSVSSSASTISLNIAPTSVYVIVTSGSVAPPAPNLILNPSFESALTSWSENWGNASVVQSNASAGSYSLRVGPAAGGRAQALSSVVANKTYKLTFYGKVSQAGDAAWAGVKFRDAAGKDIAGASFSAAVTSIAYQQYEVTFTAPSSYSSVIVWAYKNAGSAYIYLDDFSLKVQ